MKTTPKRTRTLYNQLKQHMATLVSTLVLAACTAAPVPALATSVHIPSSSFSKLCFTTSTIVHSVLQIKDPVEAIERMEFLLAENPSTNGFTEGMERLFYFGLMKRNIYRGDNLKQVLMLECPTIFRETLN